MYRKIIKNDLCKSRLITVTITGFVMLAALFAALGLSLTVNLLGAINQLSADAKASHYMQMHSGGIDLERLDRFVSQHHEIAAVQAAKFLNIAGADIRIGEYTLADSIQDNGVAVQNERLDLLLDVNNQPVYPRDGEIYVPVYYFKEGFAKLGDPVVIQDVSFRVAGFLRDFQMNPAMASSKRFLVSKGDYQRLAPGGKQEYILSFLFNGEVDLAKFEADYQQAGLENNGPAGTRGLIKLMNGVEDGLMIAMLMLIGILILMVTLLSVRFTLMTKMEEDYREIGVLKAIGLRLFTIRKLYLAKYCAISAAGCTLGFFLSLFLQEPVLENIRLYLGRSQQETWGLLGGGCGVFLVFAAVLCYVNRMLGRFRKISAVQAIRFGAPRDETTPSRGFSLSRSRLFPPMVFMGIKDVLSRKKLYLIMFLVLVISCFIMVVPQNISNTIADPSFMTYLGIGECDIRLDVHLAEDIPEKAKDMGRALALDQEVEKYSILTCWMFDLLQEDGSIVKLKAELGDHSAFPLTYQQGREPRGENEIALSALNSKELQKGIGDTIRLVVDGQIKTLKVCGLYSDITNGGMTAKAAFGGKGEKAMWLKVPVQLKSSAHAQMKAAGYKQQFAYAKVSLVEDYLAQSLGPTAKAVQNISAAAIGVSVFLTVLITLLFMKMLITRDRYQIWVLKSLGFTGRKIRQQYLVRAGIVLVLGAAAGTALANTLGETIGSGLMSAFGVSAFHFNVNRLFAYGISPLVAAACVYGAVWLSLFDIETINAAKPVKE